MIDIRKLKELVRLMVSSGLTELDLRDSEEQVTLRRHLGGPATHMSGPAITMVPAMPMATGAAGPAVAEADEGDSADATESADIHRIESPMVGTFYAAGQPDAPPLATVGMTVSADTVVCLIEAMKIFNEIKAECSGTIRKVLVKNGEAVEFGQPLFLVEPA